MSSALSVCVSPSVQFVLSLIFASSCSLQLIWFLFSSFSIWFVAPHGKNAYFYFSLSVWAKVPLGSFLHGFVAIWYIKGWQGDVTRLNFAMLSSNSEIEYLGWGKCPSSEMCVVGTLFVILHFCDTLILPPTYHRRNTSYLPFPIPGRSRFCRRQPYIKRGAAAWLLPFFHFNLSKMAEVWCRQTQIPFKKLNTWCFYALISTD